MDTVLIDISHLDFIPIAGSSVVIFDGETYPELSIENIAENIGTIPYELTCGLARRLQRRYVWRGQILLWDDLKDQLGIIAPNEG